MLITSKTRHIAYHFVTLKVKLNFAPMAYLTKNIEKAKAALNNGDLVAIPTETVYGLAANATSIDAVKSIFKTKGRPSNNPLILHFSNFDAISPYVASISDDVKLLAKSFWPGPLTLLLPKTDLVPEIITAGLPRVAVRVPSHPLTIKLLNELNYPLAAPSANPSGYISPTKASHVEKQLGDKIEFILDGGNCKKGLESTILGWNDNNKPTLYRQGVITAKDIEEVLKKEVVIHTPNSGRLEAPGMLSSHYAPKTKTIISDSIESTIRENSGLKLGLIKAFQPYKGPIIVSKQIVLSSNNLLEEVAQKLYASMHELDALDLDLIIIEKVIDEDIGLAINDRLKRSAVK